MSESLFILGVELKYSGEKKFGDVIGLIETPELLKNYKLLYNNINNNIYFVCDTWEASKGYIKKQELSGLIGLLSYADDDMEIDNIYIDAISDILPGLSIDNEKKLNIYVENPNQLRHVNLNDYSIIKTQECYVSKKQKNPICSNNIVLPKRKYPSLSHEHDKYNSFISTSDNDKPLTLSYKNSPFANQNRFVYKINKR
jgi:hypothetical protein